MGQPAARLTDMHACPLVNGIVPHVGGPISGPCAPTVLIGGLPAARVTDMAVCVGPPDVIATGSMTVTIVGLPAARVGDTTVHGGAIVTGLPTVMIGDTGGGGSVATGAGGDLSAMISQGPAFCSPQARAQIEASANGRPFCARCAAAAAKLGGSA